VGLQDGEEDTVKDGPGEAVLAGKPVTRDQAVVGESNARC